MRPSPHDALTRWLAAERDDHPEAEPAAETALLELFATLPLVAPPAGFADRVLARAALAVPGGIARRDPFASRWARLVLAAALLATSLGVLWLPSTLRAARALVQIWSVNDLVQSGVQALVDAVHGLASVLRVWDLVLTIVRAIAQPLTLPQVMAVLLGCLVASALAFRYLRDQISGERNWTYVDSI
jgi:hypothetical protein